MSGLGIVGEAAFLGLASGPACVASCGPVLVPGLLAEQSGLRVSAHYLSTFLGTRFIGYMMFALVAALLGQQVSLHDSTRMVVYGFVHLALGVVLLGYAWSAGRACSGEACASRKLVTIGVRSRRGVPGAAVLGLLTGISLCPPFVAAGLRAAELGSVAAALIFFSAFFIGTSLWFLPFMGMSCIRRNEAVITVARMAMVIIALYYGGTGAAMLMGRNTHGY
jgi:sulfite exporter TauE/SafE